MSLMTHTTRNRLNTHAVMASEQVDDVDSIIMKDCANRHPDVRYIFADSMNEVHKSK